MEIDLTGLLLVAAVAFLAPLASGSVPQLRVPAVVVELVAGIVIGPSVLGWVEPDAPVRVLSLIGLVFLLFLAGLELDFDRLGGRMLVRSGLGFAFSFGLALMVAAALAATGQVEAPLLVAIILVATALGVVVPVLKDTGQLSSGVGQLVIAAASIADVGAIVLLSLLFSRESTSPTAKLALLVGFVAVAVAVLAVLLGIGRSHRLTAVLRRLQDTTAQIRVRGSFVVLLAFVVIADRFGLEVILGAFLAGAGLRLLDRDGTRADHELHARLDTIGYGVFIPVFFVASGVTFDLGSLGDDPAALARVPLLVVALLIVRGVPAVLFRPDTTWPETVAAGLLQATSLPFIVATTMFGIELGLLEPSTAAGLVTAGLISVVLFPAIALNLLRPAGADATPDAARPVLRHEVEHRPTPQPLTPQESDAGRRTAETTQTKGDTP